jgi:hypothetical protein
MAKVKNIPPGGRGTRRPGRLVQTVGRGGALIIKKWPRKRGPIKSEAQRHTAEQFALAQRAAAECHPWSYLEAENISHGTIWNRREILVKAAQGNMMEITLADGSFYGGWFNLAREIQALLDTITDEPGAILVRNSEGWVGLAPGENGYSLTANGPGFPPSWQATATPAPSAQWSTVDCRSVYTGANLSIGNDYVPALDLEISTIAARITPEVGATYMLTICELSPIDRISVIHQQFDITAEVFAHPLTAVVPLPVVQVFNAGVRYAVLLSKSNGAPSSGIDVWQAFSDYTPFPVCQQQQNVFFNVAVPVVNQLVVEATSQTSINFKFREL